MSVRKPSRPWLMPISGTSKRREVARAIDEHRAVAADDDRDVGGVAQRVRRSATG